MNVNIIKRALISLFLTVSAAGCMTTGGGNGDFDPLPPVETVTIDQRKLIAAETCEAQYAGERQNYLSAVQNVIAEVRTQPNMNNAPLESFRAEINAAYNAMVMRCKTHTNCLEVQSYNEAACYMSATDRKDAERRFSDLSQRLRQIERDYDKQLAMSKKKKRGARVTVTTNVNQANDQNQSNDTHVGDDVEDQDVLALCSDAGNLLNRRCRVPCSAGRC